jgi:hypothetical protein
MKANPTHTTANIQKSAGHTADNKTQLAAAGPVAAVTKLQQQVGNRAVGRLLQAPAESDTSHVQRLMDWDAFKALTFVKNRMRSDVSGIDKLLKKYGTFGGDKAGIKARKPVLDQLQTLAQDYTEGKRLAGVTTLLGQVNVELGYITPLFESIQKLEANTDLKNAAKLLFQSQDALLAAEMSGHVAPKTKRPDLSAIFGEIQRALQEAGIREQVMRELIQEDLDKLDAMANDPSLDPLLRNILTELLANRGNTYFQETQGMASGAVLTGAKDRGKGITEKYRVDMNLFQPGGSDERLSSLVHEMTHVATNVAFDNTALHLAFDGGATDGDILTLSAERTLKLANLKTVLESNVAPFNPDQVLLLQGKIDYPVTGKNTLLSYATSFLKKKEISQVEFDHINLLYTQGANNTLIEYDTVVNQMYFLVNSWKIPATHPFFAALQTMANDAYVRRTT